VAAIESKMVDRNGSAITSSAANKLHHFQPITILEKRAAMLRFRNDFKVPLDRDPSWIICKRGDQSFYAGSVINLMTFPVQKYLHLRRS
jgi:hypothetical protein